MSEEMAEISSDAMAEEAVTDGSGYDGEQSAEEAAAEQVRYLEQQDLNARIRAKVNGGVKEMTVAEALQLAQKAAGADQKFQEAAQIRRQWEEYQSEMARLRKDPAKLLEKMGYNPDEWSEQYLTKKLEEMGMSEEELENQRKLAEYEEWKAQQEELKKQQEQEAEGAEVEAAMKELSDNLLEAFKESGLPNNKFYFQQAVAYMIEAQDKGVDLPPKKAIDIVKKRADTNIRDLFSNLDAKAIREVLGDDILDKLRKLDLEMVSQAPRPESELKVTKRSDREFVPHKKSASGYEPVPTMSEAEWFANRFRPAHQR